MRAFVASSVLVIASVTGCAGPHQAAPPAPSTPAISRSAAVADAEPAAPCHTAQLSARLGSRTDMGGGQGWISLIYTNTSGRPCVLRGVPGADLRGPDDPNGPVYRLSRQNAGVSDVQLPPRASASARLVVLSDQGGSVGSFGSKGWVPTQLVTIPPGETTALTVPWPAGLSVLRQDSATHPGSWIGPFTAG
jgi:uncharacterized protein DUF4232